MKISIVTDSTTTPPTELVLADDSNTPDTGVAPAGEVRVLEETTVQESKPIGAARRSLFNRKNAAGTLSFTVRPRYSALWKASNAAWNLALNRGTQGQLKVVGIGVAEGGTTATRDGALVQKVETRQIGVTVEAKYEIAF